MKSILNIILTILLLFPSFKVFANEYNKELTLSVLFCGNKGKSDRIKNSPEQFGVKIVVLEAKNIEELINQIKGKYALVSGDINENCSSFTKNNIKNALKHSKKFITSASISHLLVFDKYLSVKNQGLSFHESRIVPGTFLSLIAKRFSGEDENGWHKSYFPDTENKISDIDTSEYTIAAFSNTGSPDALEDRDGNIFFFGNFEKAFVSECKSERCSIYFHFLLELLKDYDKQ